MSLLPKNYILQEEYDAHVRKSRLRLIYQAFVLNLARIMLPTRLRIALYRAMGAQIGKDVYIGVDTYLDERYPELITFEEDSGPSARATFIAHGEAYDEAGNRIRFVAPIVVKPSAWVGSHSIVCPGVTIGRNAIIGSGAVITQDIPDYAFASGNPVRVIELKDATTDGRARFARVREMMKRT
jgi:maltose O-acetyltransferase